ncbi:MAG: hypothetical protein E6Q67_12875 [Roseateles sp.]|nr:MAG: hypothetical protein E6Q67_12875 [Roseateles sp.]
MAITVRHIRHGLQVRLTGAHAQAVTGLLLNLLERPEPAADKPDRVPERSEMDSRALGAEEAVGGPNAA